MRGRAGIGVPGQRRVRRTSGAELDNHRTAARPLALRLADVLELRPASFELPEQMRPARRLMKKACPQLISHPKDGAVIYQEGKILPVRSNLKGTVWYLNGKRAVMNKENIVIQDGGFYKLTAASKACRQTIVFEIQKQ